MTGRATSTNGTKTSENDLLKGLMFKPGEVPQDVKRGSTGGGRAKTPDKAITAALTAHYTGKLPDGSDLPEVNKQYGFKWEGTNRSFINDVQHAATAFIKANSDTAKGLILKVKFTTLMDSPSPRSTMAEDADKKISVRFTVHKMTAEEIKAAKEKADAKLAVPAK